MRCPSDRYTAFGDSYLSTISINPSWNRCNFNCCHSPRSQLYPPSKFCNILQHTDDSGPCSHHSNARTRGIMNYHRWSNMPGRSWSAHFSVFHMSGPQSQLVIQPCNCPELVSWVKIFTFVFFNSKYVGLNQPPIRVSIVYLDMSDTIRKSRAWRIHLIWCIWRFQNHNIELASAESIWTSDLSSGTIPGTPIIESTSGNHHFLQPLLELHPPWRSATSLPHFPVIRLNFILYLPLYASVYILQFQFIFINMEPTASQVRNHHSQKNQETHLERALAHAFKKTPNHHCLSNVWTSSLQV